MTQADREALRGLFSRIMLSLMRSATLVEDFDTAFEFTPVEGRSNEYVIHSKLPRRCAEKEMTPEDWDKFEKDISDAFEQVP